MDRVVLLQAQAYLGVFYMRGLQPREKRGLKYLLQAANSGVSNPARIVLSLRSAAAGFQGFLEMGMSVRISLPRVKGQTGASWRGARAWAQTLQRQPCWAGAVPTAPGPVSSFQDCAAFPLWSIYTLFSQKLSLLHHLENFIVFISDLFFGIGTLFLSFYREDGKTISGFSF